MRPAFMVSLAMMVCVAAPGCSRFRNRPVAAPPPLPAPETRLYKRPYDIVWDTVRVDLVNDDRLDTDTIDKRGRFVAWTKSNSIFLLRGSRKVVTIELEPVGDTATRMVLQMSAQRYDAGGLRRPAGWYPARAVDEAMGEKIAARIDKRLDHTPGLADEIALDALAPAETLPPAPEAYKPRPKPYKPPRPSAASAEPASASAAEPEQQSWWRRLWPFNRS